MNGDLSRGVFCLYGLISTIPSITYGRDVTKCEQDNKDGEKKVLDVH